MIAIIVHGGATSIAPAEEQVYRAGCLAAMEAGWAVLKAGGSALDAVEMAVRALETDPTFNAGYGGALNADGEVELCSAVMEGADLRFGALAVATGLPHPVSVARRLLELQGPRLLAAHGAERFAREQGQETCDPAALITERQRRKLEGEQGGGHDTVGCVARDAAGRLATATSTGGLVGSPAGRVGDSPVPGGGFYVDDRVGGCVLTGDGEHIAQLVLAKQITEQLAAGITPGEAAATAIAMLAARVGGEGGCVVLSQAGGVGWAHSSSHMACAYRTSYMDGPVVTLKHDG